MSQPTAPFRRVLRFATRASIAVACLAGACSDPTTTTTTYPVGGVVTGLVGSGLVLRDNGGDDLRVTANGPVVFATSLASGDAYSVTVFAQPTNPAQTCSVAGGSGTVTHDSVMAVAIACATTNAYTVGGTVSGLVGSGLVLLSNWRDDLIVTANGPVVFATPLPSGTPYSVAVFAQPTTPAQTCVVTGGSGTMASANVTTVAIACVTNVVLGAVRVTASTAGGNIPPTYTVDASGSSAIVPANGTVSVDLAPGAHTVSLTVAPNCTVTSPNPIPVTVASGATTDIAFSVTCGASGDPLRVTVATTGTDAPATYTVRATGAAFTYGSYSAPIPSNGAVSLAVRPGDYEVRLVVPLNCTVTSPNNVGASPARGTGNVRFSVTCVSAGTLAVTVATTGRNAPTTYTLGLYPYWGGGLYSAPISSNGTATMILPPGSHTVLLAVPPNCALTGPNNVSVNVLARRTSNHVFTVACQ